MNNRIIELRNLLEMYAALGRCYLTDPDVNKLKDEYLELVIGKLNLTP